MRHFSLKRMTDNGNSTTSILKDKGGYKLFNTLENAWKDNQTNISCIPIGEYVCDRYGSKRHGNTFIVKDVPGRSGILFHKGNWAKDTEGCILLGKVFIRDEKNGTGVGRSADAVAEFLHLLRDDDSFLLTIEGIEDIG